MQNVRTTKQWPSIDLFGVEGDILQVEHESILDSFEILNANLIR